MTEGGAELRSVGPPVRKRGDWTCPAQDNGRSHPPPRVPEKWKGAYLKRAVGPTGSRGSGVQPAAGGQRSARSGRMQQACRCSPGKPPDLRQPRSWGCGVEKRLTSKGQGRPCTRGAGPRGPRPHAEGVHLFWGATWPWRRWGGGWFPSLPGGQRRDWESLGASATGEQGVVWLCSAPRPTAALSVQDTLATHLTDPHTPV